MPWMIIRAYYWIQKAQSNAENSFTAGRIWALKNKHEHDSNNFVLNKQNFYTNRRENSPKYCPYCMKQNTFHFCVCYHCFRFNKYFKFVLNRLEVAISQKLVPRFLFRFVHKHNYTRASYVNTCSSIFQYFPNFPTTWWLLAKGISPTHSLAPTAVHSPNLKVQHASNGDGNRKAHPRDRWWITMGYQRVITMGWQRCACEKHYKICFFAALVVYAWKTVSNYCRQQKKLGKYNFVSEFNKSWAWACVKLCTPIERVSPTQ